MDIIKLWETYAEKFDLLSDMMIKRGLDIELLVDVIRAAIDLHSYT